MITPIAASRNRTSPLGYEPSMRPSHCSRDIKTNIPLSRTTVNQALPTVTSSTFKVVVSLIQTYAVSTVHPLGTPLAPLTFHVAALFLTNVPLAATPFTQLFVYAAFGVVVNIAFI